MNRDEVYAVIDGEREYQGFKWGSGHDIQHTIGDWIVYIRHHLNEAERAHATCTDDIETLNQLRKVVALGVACFEQCGVPARGG